MSKLLYFTPGPAALYPGVSDFLNQALEEQIPSISHRSNQFRAIYQDTFETLKALLGLPQGSAVFFTGSATEVWEKLLLNCVEESSYHLVNGSFSNKFKEAALQLKKPAVVHEVPFGQGFDVDALDVDYKCDFMAITQNETSSGVQMPVADIHALKDRYPTRLLTVDMVSSAPYPALDFSKVDSAYFSVQKAFGLPAGLGVWIANEKCLARAESLENKAAITGSHHRLVNYWKYFEKFECPSTPNVLGIYLLGRVARAMLEKGIHTIRQEIQDRAQSLYSVLEENPLFQPFVQNPAHRSDTVIVANTEKPASEIREKAQSRGMILGSGYRDWKEKQIRIANFPAIRAAEFEKLLYFLKKL